MSKFVCLLPLGCAVGKFQTKTHNLTCHGLIVIGMAAILSLSAFHVRAGTCTVNLGTAHQTAYGFGGSIAWSGPLSSAQNDTLWGYANNNQLRFSLCRVCIDPAEGNNSWNIVTLSPINLSAGSFTTSLPAQSLTMFLQN